MSDLRKFTVPLNSTHKVFKFIPLRKKIIIMLGFNISTSFHKRQIL